MEPTKSSFGAELPEPVQTGGGETIQPIAPEAQPRPQAPVTPTPQPVIDTSMAAPSQSVQAPVATPVAATSPMIADDADLIEKEWVLRAKAIVAQTVHDPHLQTKEVSKMKADYMQKRYNKQLKLEES